MRRNSFVLLENAPNRVALEEEEPKLLLGKSKSLIIYNQVVTTALKYGRTILLLLLPILGAFRSIIFLWSRRQNPAQMSLILPILIATACLAFGWFMTLLVQHGYEGVRGLRARRFLIIIVPAFCRMGMIFEFMALTNGVSATMLTLVTKANLLPSMWGEMYLTTKRPYPTQVFTLLSLLMCIAVYSLLGNGLSVTVVGMLLAIASSACQYATSFTLEMISRYMANANLTPQEEKAEITRIMFVNEFFKVFLLIGLMLAFEWKFVQIGLFRDWTWDIIGRILPIISYSVAWVLNIILNGTLKTNIALTGDIGAAYLLEAALLKGPFEVVRSLLIVAVTGMILIYQRFRADLNSALLKAQASSPTKAVMCASIAVTDEAEMDSIKDDASSAIEDIDVFCVPKDVEEVQACVDVFTGGEVGKGGAKEGTFGIPVLLGSKVLDASKDMEESPVANLVDV